MHHTHGLFLSFCRFACVLPSTADYLSITKKAGSQAGLVIKMCVLPHSVGKHV